MEKDGKITKKQNNRNTIITICKYNDFQSTKKRSGTTDDTTDSASDEHQTDIKQDTNNNDNKNNKLAASAGEGACAGEGDAEDFNKVFNAGVALFPQLGSTNQQPIAQWLADGYSPELDIIPTFKLKAENGYDPNVWAAFTKAIPDFKKKRLQKNGEPVPIAIPEPPPAQTPEQIERRQLEDLLWREQHLKSAMSHPQMDKLAELKQKYNHDDKK
jgi:hypothetical protein